MPIYEYQCPDCGHRFDAMQKFSDDPITVCPRCEGRQVKKLISATAFVLKGSGWYKDHYGLKSGSGESKSAGGESRAEAGSASSGSSASASTPSSSPAPASGSSSGSAAAS